DLRVLIVISQRVGVWDETQTQTETGQRRGSPPPRAKFRFVSRGNPRRCRQAEEAGQAQERLALRGSVRRSVGFVIRFFLCTGRALLDPISPSHKHSCHPERREGSASRVHARYYWLLSTGGYLTRRRFGAILGRIELLPVPTG